MSKLPIILALALCATVSFAAISIASISPTFAKEGGESVFHTRGSGTWTATKDTNWIGKTKAGNVKNSYFN